MNVWAFTPLSQIPLIMQMHLFSACLCTNIDYFGASSLI
jgi:hypothetical protein